MMKSFLIFLMLALAINCKQHVAISNRSEQAPIRIQLRDSLKAKPPLNMDYDNWISAYPNMKNLKALGGVCESTGGVKFTISIGDGNNNGIFGEAGRDVIYLTEYSEKYFEWDNSCSNVSVVQPKTFINYHGNCFVVDSISPVGSFIDLKKISCTQQTHLWKSINLPLEQKLNVMDGEAISILDYLESYSGKTEYVFVNFWAPWCAPCIEDIPQLHLLQQKNVVIINIFEEYSYEEAKIAISKYSMPGLQVAGEAYVSKLFNHCGSGFPYGILYKRNQEIGRNVNAHQVIKQIKKP